MSEERGERGAATEIPAKIPVGMTEREYWAMEQVELQRDLEEVGERRLRGLTGDGWREVRDLPAAGYARR
jgi:hypothetical protein